MQRRGTIERYGVYFLIVDFPLNNTTSSSHRQHEHRYRRRRDYHRHYHPRHYCHHHHDRVVISAFVIILKYFIFLFLEKYGELPTNLSLMQHGFQKLNRYQETAVREALSKPFTLIQGPPGTSFASCD